MRITIRLFAILRERCGINELALDLPQGSTVAAARDEFQRRFPQSSDIMARAAYAVNRSYAPVTTDLQEGDEVAVIPPVSGG
ncbi:MAG TPA: molybdopterin converting factor subunit 1 [Tepidisphaeraceae bacterium]|jgi:molybdopterin converting factor subunit 1|nr:molybdopterin converting factor subunit 1 [Tepidisphaeraceae bacterium]